MYFSCIIEREKRLGACAEVFFFEFAFPEPFPFPYNATCEPDECVEKSRLGNRKWDEISPDRERQARDGCTKDLFFVVSEQLKEVVCCRRGCKQVCR